jgi:hypothetical protein
MSVPLPLLLLPTPILLLTGRLPAAFTISKQNKQQQQQQLQHRRLCEFAQPQPFTCASG